MKKHFFIFFLHVILCSILTVLLNKGLTLLHLINSIFYISSFYLIIGLLLFVISRRFFDITANSFRKVLTRITKQKNWASTWSDDKLPSEKINQNWMIFFLLQGSFLLLLMIILLILFYY